MEQQEIEYHIKRIEAALMTLQDRTRIYLGICVNQSLHPDRNHPHWDDEQPNYDWHKPIIS